MSDGEDFGYRSGGGFDWKATRLEATESHVRDLKAEIERLTAERDAFAKEAEENKMRVITCGVAAEHSDANLTRTGAYAKKWDSAQAESVRKLRDERDELRRQLAEAEQDARRYQWLRENLGKWRIETYQTPEQSMVELPGQRRNDMGFGSTFVTNDLSWKWPAWFRERYAGNVHFPRDGGPISSVGEMKTYGYFADLHTDIHRALREDANNDYDWCIVLVYLHECGGITRCEIRRDSIRWNEPTGWRTTDGVEHDYCYGCSDVPAEE